MLALVDSTSRRFKLMLALALVVFTRELMPALMLALISSDAQDSEHEVS